MNGIGECLPKDQTGENKNRIGYLGLPDREITGFLRENKDSGGHDRRQKSPDVAEEGMAVAGADVTNQEAPRKFARNHYVPQHSPK